MKLRIEPEGVHLYDRSTGLHILFDEVATNPKEYSIAPRTISLAITDKCDFSCSYCYVNLKSNFLEKEAIIKYCEILDSLGTFDIAFGGGEPTLHPDLIEICQTVWKNTQLGISITTHGHNLSNKNIDDLKGHVSLLRFSIDGVEPIYSKLRKEPLESLLKVLSYTKGKIPFGFNTVVNSLSLYHLDQLLQLALEFEVKELLLLPMVNKGKIVLKQGEWDYLNTWIETNRSKIPMSISVLGKDNLKTNTLFNSKYWDKDYAFIGVNNTFRETSFSSDGIKIENNLEKIVSDWKIRHLDFLQINSNSLTA